MNLKHIIAPLTVLLMASIASNCFDAVPHSYRHLVATAFGGA